MAWVWYGLAFSEEMTEQGKAEAASNTMAGTGLLFGGIPLLFVYVVALVPMLLIVAKYHARRARGILLALIVVAAASAVGIAVGQVLWAGCLFAMSATSVCPAYVP